MYGNDIWVLCFTFFWKDGKEDLAVFQVVVRRFQERSEDKMSVVDDVIAVVWTEQVSERMVLHLIHMNMGVKVLIQAY